MRHLVVVLVLAVAAPAAAQHASVRVQAIDRGQADGFLIRTPNDQWVVIDAGSNDRQMVDAMQNDWGVDRVALLVVSHRHYDHFGGVPRLLRSGIPVDRFIGHPDDCPNRATDDTVRHLLDSLNVQELGRDADTVTVDGVRFIVLPPDPIDNRCPNEEYDNSVIVRLEFGDCPCYSPGTLKRSSGSG